MGVASEPYPNRLTLLRPLKFCTVHCSETFLALKRPTIIYHLYSLAQRVSLVTSSATSATFCSCLRMYLRTISTIVLHCIKSSAQPTVQSSLICFYATGFYPQIIDAPDVRRDLKLCPLLIRASASIVYDPLNVV